MLQKSIFILTFFHLSAIFLSSCRCDCDETIAPFDFETTEVTLLDNANEYTRPATEDTLVREAVAFQLFISSPTTAHNACRSVGFGYQSAYAWSCDCRIPHVPQQQIVGIKIFDENSGQEITEQFVALTSQWNSNGLYLSLAEALDRLQQEQPYDGPGTSIQLFLTVPPTTAQVSYRIVVSLSDDRTLTATTPMIFLR